MLLIHKSLCFSLLPIPFSVNMEAVLAIIKLVNCHLDDIFSYCPYGNCFEAEFRPLVMSVTEKFLIRGDFNCREQWEDRSCANGGDRSIAVVGGMLKMSDHPEEHWYSCRP